MTWLFLGAFLLFCSILLVQWFLSADPKSMARVVRITGAVLMALLSIPLLWRGNMALGLPMLGAAGMLLGIRTPFLRDDLRSGPRGRAGRRGPSAQTNMSRAEALEILGLQEGASEEDIISAHKELMLKIHPDMGGTDYLATKLNQARDVLLGN